MQSQFSASPVSKWPRCAKPRRTAAGKAGRRRRHIRIVLADDHPMVREGLQILLQQHAGVRVVGQAATGRQCVELVREHRPDVVLMDVCMPDICGIEATRRILGLAPQPRVVALSACHEEATVRRMLRAGACGYVLKTGVSGDLMAAIKAAVAGKRYLSAELADCRLDRHCHEPEQGVHPLPQLRPRERQVLALLANGQSSKQIAAALSISVRTVESHRRNISGKLGLHGLAELTKYAIRHGMTEP